MNQLPKPGMLFTNSTFRMIYLVLNVKYHKKNQSYFNDRDYFIIYVLTYDNKITGYGVPKEKINNLYGFLNWEVVQ